MRVPKLGTIKNVGLMNEMKVIIGECEYPTCRRRQGLEVHHIFGRGLGGGKRRDVPEGLAVVCREHHQLAHKQFSRDGKLSFQEVTVGKRPDHVVRLIEGFLRKQAGEG